jgi:predicted aspartyl protease
MKKNFVYITVNNNRTQALVDTGAVISCITEQHLRKLIITKGILGNSSL